LHNPAPITTGKWYISFLFYIPENKTGYFNTLSEFPPIFPYDIGMEVAFLAGGMGLLFSIPDTQIFTWHVAQWNKVVVIVDLDENELSSFWIGLACGPGPLTKVAEWPWKQGPSYLNQLAATEFKGGEATNEMYIDDFIFTDFTNLDIIVGITDGWNMVSVPGINPDGMGVNDWWPNRSPSTSVFRYNADPSDPPIGYRQLGPDPGVNYTVQKTTGYWMKHICSTLYGYDITPFTHVPIPVFTGWNMIGGYENSAPTSGLTTTPPGLISGSVYGYSGTYVTATNLVPGYGYWIKLTGAGVINIPSGPLSKGSGEVVEYFKDDWGRIIITDNAGRSYTLYSVKGEVELDNYELPPVPPAGVFDIRYGSGRIAEDINEALQSIEMTGIEHPIRIQVENMDIRLQDETGKEINENIKSGEEITISNNLINKLLVISGGLVAPIEYALEQNYPNPFNPSTRIKYSILQSSNVIIKVFDILGKEIETLVNEEKSVGTYEITWYADNLPSGIYFYKLQAGSFVETKKMILLK